MIRATVVVYKRGGMFGVKTANNPSSCTVATFALTMNRLWVCFEYFVMHDRVLLAQARYSHFLRSEPSPPQQSVTSLSAKSPPYRKPTSRSSQTQNKTQTKTALGHVNLRASNPILVWRQATFDQAWSIFRALPHLPSCPPV